MQAYMHSSVQLSTFVLYNHVVHLIHNSNFVNASQKNVKLDTLKLLLRPCLGQNTISLPAVSVASSESI